MTNDDNVVRGQPVSQEEKEEFASLRAIFDPQSALTRMDSYGKWLFGSAAVVGSLGAGLSNTAFSKLRGPGIWLFAVAIVALGCCLVSASLSIAPHWAKAQVNDLNSLRRAVGYQFRVRQRQLTASAVLLFYSLSHLS
jgi:hypothetical protein